MTNKPKITALASAAMLLGAASSAFADRDGAQYDYARVLSSQPIVNYVTVKTPVRECWTETERYADNRYSRRYSGDRGAGTLFGAIIGGVIGHQFGSGRGNDAATVAGTLIGAAVGNDAARQNSRYGNRYGQVRTRPVERCETQYREHREKRIDGYSVTYRYNGQKYRTEMPYDPGESIRVRVDVRPAQ